MRLNMESQVHLSNIGVENNNVRFWGVPPCVMLTYTSVHLSNIGVHSPAYHLLSQHQKGRKHNAKAKIFSHGKVTSSSVVYPILAQG
ncbi:hypothetical protein AQUCO_03000138v1 [Aquilegia coerulea]|uniref:Uncharacterized protein n=1 Tax=Aquilegia coerulea TaxID=218851 RepID=A0A2G5D1D9_AQUCA|nr:hypothetical protein AQUCO_03000138v1 [Aquilegia coerulea]